MMKMAFTWVEVWIDSASLEYVLILRQSQTVSIELFDPVQHTVVKTFDTYDNACLWLNEDEYDLIQGRYLVEN